MKSYLTIFLFICSFHSLQSQSNASNETELFLAITTYNSFGGDYTINITSDFMVAVPMPMITASIGILGTLTIQGNNHKISGTNSSNLFVTEGPTSLHIFDLTLEGFAAEQGGAIYSTGELMLTACHFKFNLSEYGGAVYAAFGNLHITDCSFENNEADFGGAIYSEFDVECIISESSFSSNIALLDGGAILCNDKLTLTGSHFNDNQSSNGAAVFSGFGVLTTVDDCEFSFNNSTGEGGAIFTNGEINICHSTFQSNSATSAGGAVFSLETVTMNRCSLINNMSNQGAALYGFETLVVDSSLFQSNRGSFSGAIHSEARLDLTHSNFLLNESTNDGGAIFSGTEMNATNNHFQSNSAKRGGAITTQSEPNHITSCSFIENAASENGGAIQNIGNAIIKDSHFESNQSISTSGGAIVNSGELTVDSSVFILNVAETEGGAIENQNKLFVFHSSFIENSSGEKGGAILNNADIDIQESLFEKNHSVLGGAIYEFGSNATIANSTFSANATPMGQGGAIYSESFSLLVLDHVTMSLNVSSTLGSAVFAERGDTRIRHSYIAGNTDFVQDLNVGSGTITLLDDNVLGMVDASILIPSNNVMGDDGSSLMPLGWNGGLTKTHRLSPSSPAIGKVNTTTLLQDQRGVHFARPSSNADAGAFESGACLPSFAASTMNRLVGTQLPFASYDTDGMIESEQVVQIDPDNLDVTSVSYSAAGGVDLLEGFESNLGVELTVTISGCAID